MLFDGAHAEVQDLGDFRIAFSFGHPMKDFALTRRQCRLRG